MSSITFENTTIRYKGNDKRIIKDENLVIDSGFNFLIGESGSGKTTSLSAIYFDLIPDMGRIIVDLSDNDDQSLVYDSSRISHAKIQEFRRQIGIISQTFNLQEHLTPRQSISSILEYLGYSKKEIDERSSKALEIVDLSEKADMRLSQLSGGERQRIQSAVVFAKQPKIILADEPTGNLDPGLSRRVIDYLYKYQQEYDIPVIVATHDSNLLKEFDGNVLMLNQQQIKKIPFTSDELMKRVEKKMIGTKQT